MTISEPMTVITDGLMALVLAILGGLLLRKGRSSAQRSVQWWGYAFIVMAVAAVGAGVSHGIGRNFEPATLEHLWKLTVDLVGVGSFLMLVGTFLACMPRPWSIFLIVLAVPKFVAYAVWVATHHVGFDDYRIVIYDYGSAMTIVFACAAFAAWRRERAGWWLMGGILVGGVATIVQQSGIVLHEYFNYNDMYHLISVGSFYLIYRGATLLRDRQ